MMNNIMKDDVQNNKRNLFKNLLSHDNIVNARFASSDVEATKLILDDIIHKIYSSNGRIMIKHDNIWTSNTNVIDSIFFNYIINSNIFYGINKKTGKYIPYLQNVTHTNDIKTAIYKSIYQTNYNPHVYELLHTSTKHKICFNDGVLDFKHKTFTLWEDCKDVYSVVKINRNYYEYFNNPNFKIINTIHESIFKPLYDTLNTTSNNNLEDTYLFLSRALAGHSEDKLWATYLGNRNCGKGVEYDLLKSGFGDYVSSFDLSNILCSRQTNGLCTEDASRKLYWLLDLEFVRLAVSQETPEGKNDLKINARIFKKITGGGDELIARRNHDRFDTHFYSDTTFYIKGNNTIECTTDDCDETRLKFESVIQFKSTEEINQLKQANVSEHFLSRFKLKDTTIKNKCKSIEWANAVVYLLMSKYKEVIPVTPLKNKEQIIENNLTNEISANFEITNNEKDQIPTTIVYNDILKNFDKGKINTEFEMMGIIKKKSSIQPFRNKYVFCGIKKINLEIDE